jgi:hypothetical protein
MNPTWLQEKEYVHYHDSLPEVVLPALANMLGPTVFDGSNKQNYK